MFICLPPLATLDKLNKMTLHPEMSVIKKFYSSVGFCIPVETQYLQMLLLVLYHRQILSSVL